MIASDTNSCFRVLAASVILDALQAARAGDQAARSWLIESQQVMIFCAGLNVDHSDLMRQIDAPPVSLRWPVLATWGKV